MKDCGWRFDSKNSMTVYFYQIGEMNALSYVKIALRSSAIINIESDDKYCSLWSQIAYLHLCFNNHPNRVSNYRPFFNEINSQDFDFTN